MSRKPFFFMATCLLVQGTADETKPTHHVVYEEHPHHIYFGPQSFWFNVDTDVGKIRVDDWKCFSGFDLGYEYLKPDQLYVGVDFEVTADDSGFSAVYQGQRIPKTSSSAFSMLDFRLGYTCDIGREMLSIFLGYGAIAYGHPQGFFESMNVYSGGIRSQYEISPYFNLGLNLKALRTNRTTTRFVYQGQNLDYRVHDNLWGGEISVPFVWLVGGSRRWEIDLVPYFLKLDFSETQNIYGLQLLFGYRI